MPGKLYTFNASSFGLEVTVEDFLKARGAIALDFGSYAYVSSDAMPSLLSELVERSASSSDAAVVGQLKTELGKFAAERQRLMEDGARLASQLKSSSAEIASLKEQAVAASRAAEALRAENARLKAVAVPAAPTKAPSAAADMMLKQSYERLVREFQQLRSQSIEAITSVKVLEDENTNLQEEIEMLRAQAKNASAPKA
jgi:regulator of replication initiation timing